MIKRIKAKIKKHKTLIIISHIIKNYAAGLKYIAGSAVSRCGATHSVMNTEESVDYINTVVSDYMHYGNLCPADIKDKVILEIGPGDNLGVALKLISLGARKVIALDKFYSCRSYESQSKIYNALRNTLNPLEQELFDSALLTNAAHRNTHTFNKDKIDYVYGCGIDNNRCRQYFKKGAFDIILSRASLEHIRDIDNAFENMDYAFRQGGLQIHKIDLRDHNIFTSAGMHPFTFLTVPENIWRRMTCYSAGPNRKLINYYKEKMDKFDYIYRFLIAVVAGRDTEIVPHKEKLEYGRDYSNREIQLIESIRPRLLGEFRDLGRDELLPSALCLVAQKKKMPE